MITYLKIICCSEEAELASDDFFQQLVRFVKCSKHFKFKVLKLFIKVIMKVLPMFSLSNFTVIHNYDKEPIVA